MEPSSEINATVGSVGQLRNRPFDRIQAVGAKARK